jgi:hypothetical protein
MSSSQVRRQVPRPAVSAGSKSLDATGTYGANENEQIILLKPPQHHKFDDCPEKENEKKYDGKDVGGSHNSPELVIRHRWFCPDLRVCRGYDHGGVDTVWKA